MFLRLILLAVCLLPDVLLADSATQDLMMDVDSSASWSIPEDEYWHPYVTSTAITFLVTFALVGYGLFNWLFDIVLSYGQWVIRVCKKIEGINYLSMLPAILFVTFFLITPVAAMLYVVNVVESLEDSLVAGIFEGTFTALFLTFILESVGEPTPWRKSKR